MDIHETTIEDTKITEVNLEKIKPEDKPSADPIKEAGTQHVEMMRRKIEDVIEIARIHNSINNNMPIIKAEHAQPLTEYLSRHLQHETLIEEPQHPRCKFTIIVPVYNEPTENILLQLESMAMQEGVQPEDFEVIYVVNNGPLNEMSEGKRSQIKSTSQNIFDLPIWKNRPKQTNEGVTAMNDQLMRKLRALNLFVIDKSTQGNEIVGCNAGKARNRGLAESSLRSLQNGNNGIVIQTDADCTFSDPLYFKRVVDTFQGNPELIAVAGGFDFKVIINEEEKAGVEDKLKLFKLYKRYMHLYNYVKGGIDPSVTFSGANMISRNIESAIVGGLGEDQVGEDKEFGDKLKQLAEADHKQILYRKTDIKVVTQFRFSDRTGAAFEDFFKSLDPNNPPSVTVIHSENNEPLSENLYRDLVEAANKSDSGKKVVEYLEDFGNTIT